MQNKVCCCFGHRDVLEDIEGSLAQAIEKLIAEEGVNIFMTGGRGNFDLCFALTVFHLKYKYSNIKLHLVEPYLTQKLNEYKFFNELLYDSVIIPEVSANAHYRAAIPIRNQWMVDNSDIIVTYIRRNQGGAYNAVEYAEEKNKQVIHVDSQAERRPISIRFE